MKHSSDVRRQHWADVLTIAAAVTALGLAVWGYLPSTGAGGARPAAGYAALASIVAGACALAGLVLAQRRPGGGRVPVICGGLIMIAAPFAFTRPEPPIWAAMLAVGIALLTAAPFIGRMPADRGARRRSP